MTKPMTDLEVIKYIRDKDNPEWKRALALRLMRIRKANPDWVDGKGVSQNKKQ